MKVQGTAEEVQRASYGYIYHIFARFLEEAEIFIASHAPGIGDGEALQTGQELYQADFNAWPSTSAA